MESSTAKFLVELARVRAAGNSIQALLALLTRSIAGPGAAPVW